MPILLSDERNNCSCIAFIFKRLPGFCAHVSCATVNSLPASGDLCHPDGTPERLLQKEIDRRQNCVQNYTACKDINKEKNWLNLDCLLMC